MTEITPSCRLAQQVAGRLNFLGLAGHDPDTLRAAEVPLSDSDEETTPKAKDVGDTVTTETETDLNGVERTYKKEFHGKRITCRAKDRIPFHTTTEWN